MDKRCSHHIISRLYRLGSDGMRLNLICDIYRAFFGITELRRTRKTWNGNANWSSLCVLL